MSLMLHALFAALFFAVVSNSSREGATENVVGGDIVTLERRAPVIAAAQPQRAVPPAPNAPSIAPLHHAPAAQPQRQRQQQNRHELAKNVPSAPPNPSPVPPSTPQPNAQPTQAVYEVKPSIDLPAVPTAVPSASIVAVTVKTPPTAAPSPVPTAVATARPTPRAPASVAPTQRPATPVPAVPSTAPASAAAAAKATTAPTPSAPPGTEVASSPAPKAGVPSPSATAAVASKTAGNAATPGPRGSGAPGPKSGTAAQPKAAPARPVSVRPTPSPLPGNAGASKRAADLNARLRALLPNNPVNPVSKEYRGNVSVRGRLEPTPPPEIVAATKYVLEVRGSGDQARIKMWVTSVRRSGPLTVCEGWLLRFPQQNRESGPVVPGTAAHPISGGISVGIGGVNAGPPSTEAAIAPIVEANAVTDCSERDLTPFVAPVSPSP